MVLSPYVYNIARSRGVVKVLVVKEMSRDWPDISITHDLALAVASPFNYPPFSKAYSLCTCDYDTHRPTALAIGSFYQ
jgi:hypothetical protein